MYNKNRKFERKGGEIMGQQLGEVMVRAGIISAEQFAEVIKKEREEKTKKICAEIDRRFPNAPDVMKILVFIAENHPFLKNK